MWPCLWSCCSCHTNMCEPHTCVNKESPPPAHLQATHPSRGSRKGQRNFLECLTPPPHVLPQGACLAHSMCQTFYPSAAVSHIAARVAVRATRTHTCTHARARERRDHHSYVFLTSPPSPSPPSSALVQLPYLVPIGQGVQWEIDE